MSNTSIKGFMSFPTKFADGALSGVKVITKHTTAQTTRDIKVGEGERALVPAVTA